RLQCTRQGRFSRRIVGQYQLGDPSYRPETTWISQLLGVWHMACTVKGKDAAHTGEPRMKLATISMIIAVAVAISGVSALAKGKEQKKTEEQVVTIEVTGEGFVPAQVKVKANQAVKLVVTRK